MTGDHQRQAANSTQPTTRSSQLETRNVRAVLVGCGAISGAWLKAAQQQPDLQMVGLVDLDEDAARQRAAEFNLQQAAISTQLEPLLERLAPDLLLNCTIPEAHRAVTLAALGHGCHVFSEKPMAESLESAAELVTAAGQAGRTFAVVQNYRYQAGARRLKRFLDSGAIGPITTINTDFYIGAHFGGFRDHMPHVLLLDMAIHTFDLARLFSGADARSVFCQEWNPRGSWYDQHASAAAIFQMSDGSVYNYRGSWCAEGLNTSWNGSWRIIGERGSVSWDGESFRAQVVEQSGSFVSSYRELAVPELDSADAVGGHTGALRQFLDCLHTGTAPETVSSDNIKSLAMVFAAIASARSGRPVTLALSADAT